jgi:hypothetical protein
VKNGKNSQLTKSNIMTKLPNSEWLKETKSMKNIKN